MSKEVRLIALFAKWFPTFRVAFFFSWFTYLTKNKTKKKNPKTKKTPKNQKFWKLERGAPGERSKTAPLFLGQVWIVHTLECRLGHTQLDDLSPTYLQPADPNQSTSILTLLTGRASAWVLQPSVWLLASVCTVWQCNSLTRLPRSQHVLPTDRWDHQLWSLLTLNASSFALNTQVTCERRLLLCHTGPGSLGSLSYSICKLE